ncbi:hypothetical protein SEA_STARPLATINUM_209 [Streptomyces phage StarPlatinum]|uniref:Uncharacterized protein n=1 Tax=Streptomyces phage StarPlatinum TaxID=2283265 RepID=A0A345M8U7_9CAUD|nr:hypothetical protein HWB77_gp119 [Streptomyces phage StarPlatinum]AXH66918.1 hypothetical protein SEA_STARPLATINUM_209 [Streptomyces phage StarPlatinum]
MVWNWVEAAPEAVEYYKKKKAAHVADVGDIEVWRDAYGYSRLIKESDGKIYISGRDFFTIKDAKDAAAAC